MKRKPVPVLTLLAAATTIGSATIASAADAETSGDIGEARSAA
jgi:hypothetical protein